MKLSLPGLHPDRVIRLMREATARCDLNLNGLTVLTEAATGAYVVTPLLAAMAGARRVYAIAKDSRFGSAEEAAAYTYEIAEKARLRQQIEVIVNATPEIIQTADIITNSGHVRPITAVMISHMKGTAVVPLMYEKWEFRSSDLDLRACHQCGIRVGGTNERHPAIGVFNFLGTMAIKLLLEAGISVYKSQVLLVCDNDFQPYLEAGLRSTGSYVQTCSCIPDRIGSFDAVLIAVTPREDTVITQAELERIAKYSPGAVICQFFGDLDRQAIRQLCIPIWPSQEPEKGHMGILPSAVGPEPIVHLQTGGLKAAEVLYNGRFGANDPAADFVQLLQYEQR